ncbi:MAG: CHASE sensor domain-containing protein, partial [Phycisphaerae bacterium]
MRSTRDLSFKSKMLLYAASTTGMALVLCSAAVMTAKWVELRTDTPRDLAIEADILAMNLTAAVAFDDRKVAADTLAGLRADANVVMACLHKADGREFSKFVRPGSEDSRKRELETTGHKFVGDRLHMRRPVVLDAEEIGWVYVQYDLQEFYRDLVRLAGVIGIAMLLALMGAALVASKLQHVLTRPVTDLTRTAETIARDRNYSIRAVKQSGDELGTLADTFNDMLSTIEDRDRALRQAHDDLESLVKERTAALRASDKRLRGLIGDIDAIVWEADAETLHFSFVSERAETILGYPVSRWLDEPDFWVSIIHRDDRARAVAEYRGATRRREDHRFAYRAVAADGRVVWLRDIVRVIVLEDGNVQLRGLMVDITEQKRVEAELAKALASAEY